MSRGGLYRSRDFGRNARSPLPDLVGPDEAIHRRLRELADRQNRTVSELIREALARSFGQSDAERRLTTLDKVDGLWRDREDLAPDAYVRRLRRDTRRKRED